MVIITGASKGIGRFLFTELRKNGYEVIGTYHSTPQLVESELSCYYKVDISDYNQV